MYSIEYIVSSIELKKRKKIEDRIQEPGVIIQNNKIVLNNSMIASQKVKKMVM